MNNGNQNPGVYRARNAGNQGQALQHPQANQQAQIQAAGQAAPRVQVRNHAQPHLTVVGGTVASFKSDKELSKDAEAALDRYFYHLKKGSDPSRFSIGGAGGYSYHPHALGNITRGLFHDLIMYKYAQLGTVLDVGASPLRNFSRTEIVDGRPQSWVKRTTMMCPNLGVRDDYRVNDNRLKIAEKVRQYNLIEDTQPHPNRLRVDENMCHCSMDVNHFQPDPRVPAPHRGCTNCHRNFDHYVSVETYYYDGVAEGITKSLVDAHKVKFHSDAYIVVNNYAAWLKKQIKNPETNVFRQIMKIRLGKMKPEDFSVTLYGVTNPRTGLPESKHTITMDANSAFHVSADVEGNPMPYMHPIPNLGIDEFTLTEYEADDNTQYVVLYERKEQIINGEVPFELIRQTVTLKSRWTLKELESRRNIQFGSCYLSDVVEHMPDKFTAKDKTLWMADLDEKMAILHPKLETQDIMNHFAKKRVELEQHKGDVSLDIASRKESLLSQQNLVLWMKRQLFGRNRAHDISVRLVNGELHMIVLKYIKTWGGMIQSVDRTCSASASLQDVLRAFVAIGVKKNSVSILNTNANKQKQEAEKLTELTLKITEDGDAFMIARLLRIIEEDRFEKFIGGAATSPVKK